MHPISPLLLDLNSQSWAIYYQGIITSPKPIRNKLSNALVTSYTETAEMLFELDSKLGLRLWSGITCETHSRQHERLGILVNIKVI